MVNSKLTEEYKSKRLILACHMCKKQKIKCDKEMPQCGSCFKKGIPCLTTCPGTQRQVPRSYILYLEDLLCVYSEKLESMGVDLDEIKGNFPSSYDDKPVNVDLYRERFDEDNELIKLENKYIKRISVVKQASEECEDQQIKKVALPTKRSVDDADLTFKNSTIIKKQKPESKEKNAEFCLESIALTPSNSKISKNNILESYENATAMKQTESMQSMLPEYNLASELVVNGLPQSKSTILQNVSDIRDTTFKKNHSNISKTYLGDSSGIPFAKLMLTAINFQNDFDFTDGEDYENFEDFLKQNINEDEMNDIEIPVVEDNVDSFTLLPVKETQKLLKSFFYSSNTQYPIFEFSLFYNRFYKPLFGADNQFHMLENENKEIENEADINLPQCLKATIDESYREFITNFSRKIKDDEVNDESLNIQDKHKIIPLKTIIKKCKNSNLDLDIFQFELPLPQVYKKALFFYNIAASLGSCSKVLVNRTAHAITLKKRAMHWVKDALDDTHMSYSSNDLYFQIHEQYLRLESLSAMLLLSNFAMCLPSIPSVWYSLGMPLRMIIDLGLHNEKYNAELISQACTLEFNNGNSEFLNSAEFLIDIRRRLFWSTYSMDRQLALYFGRPTSISDDYLSCQMIAYRPPKSLKVDEFSSFTRVVAIAMMGIRRLQSELLNVMYASNGNVPKEFENIDDWKIDFEKRLNKWYNKRVPKNFGKSDNLKFKKEFFRINLHHTKTMLNGITPRASGNHSEKELYKLRDSTSNMIFQYKRLWVSKSLNYTWIACHNLFMCSMTYLYSLYKLDDVENMDKTIANVLIIMKSFIGTCEAAPNCYKSINVLSKAIKKLILKKNKNTKATISEPEYTIGKSDSEGTDPDLQMFFEKLLSTEPLGNNINEVAINTNIAAVSEDSSNELDFSWGLDSEHKYNGRTEQYFNNVGNEPSVSEDRKIYDMLYFHANNITSRDLGNFVSNTDNIGNERSNSFQNLGS